MSPQAPTRLLQQDFSAGSFRSVAPELIPSNGVYDIENGILDVNGAIARRGGSQYASASAATDPIVALWHGWLADGEEHTIFSTTADIWSINGAGTLTNLGGVGMPSPGRVAVYNGIMFLPSGVTYNGTILGAAAEAGDFYAVVANRLVVALDDTVHFSAIDDPATFDPTDYHKMSGGVRILGLQGTRDAAAVFTTDGVWLIRNMAYNLTDADGNVQQSLDRYSNDFVLWGDAGIAAYAGAIVAPGRDGVWIMSLGVASEAPVSFAKISGQIDTLYRNYVASGALPGQATVHRGSYVLPIIIGGVVVDTLICRLDATDRQGSRTFPWSRLGGYGGHCTAVMSIPSTARVLGATGTRLLWLDYFQEGQNRDADGSAFPFEVTLRDFTTGPLNPNTVLWLRVTYELVGGSPGMVFSGTDWGAFDWGEADWGGSLVDTGAGDTSTLQAYMRQHSSSTDWGAFDWGGADWGTPEGEFTQLTQPSPDAPSQPDLARTFRWRVGKKVAYARFKLRCEDAPDRLRIKAVEVFVRDDGRL